MDGLTIVGRVTTTQMAWCWLHANLTSAFGEDLGSEMAARVPALAGLNLWLWAMEGAAEA